MAIEGSFTISEEDGCREQRLVDTVGVYNVTTNPGGYGTPNTADTAITKIQIDVYPEGYTTPIIFILTIANLVVTAATKTDIAGVTTAFTLVNTVFPFTTAAPFVYTGEDIGNGDDSEFTFGSYVVEYKIYSGVLGATTEDEVEADVLVICQVQRAKNQANANLSTDCGDCGTVSVKNAIAASVFLDGAINNMENGETIKAGEALTYAHKLATNPCPTGC